MKDIVLVLIGALSSVIGGFLNALHHRRNAGSIKFEETIAERRVAAYGKALELIRRLQFILYQGMPKEALDFLGENGSWFADSLILLPHTYVENWRSIKGNLASAVLKEGAKQQTRNESQKDLLAEEVVDSWQSSIELAREAEASIYAELH